MRLAPSGWTAIIPLKPRGMRKTRLSPCLSPARRAQLSETLFAHVAATLREVSNISEIVLLSDERAAWPHRWIADRGTGLNRELAAARRALKPQRLLIIHADLPLVSPEDIEILLSQASAGCALAPDRHGSGTNALALDDRADFEFFFGAGSLRRHQEAAAAPPAIVKRGGLMLDIDTAADLELLQQSGFTF